MQASSERAYPHHHERSRLETRGRDVPATIHELLASRDLDGARDVLAVLHYRLSTHLEDLREQSAYDRYAPLLHRFGIDSTESRSDLKLGRILTSLEHASDVPLEEAVRGALERMDRGSTRDVTARLAHLLRIQYRIDVDELDADELREAAPGARIAGLIETAPDFGDPDFTQALRDRETAIQLRAELLVDRAIADDAPWLQALGERIPGNDADWRRRAITVACYRDLYGVDSDDPLGREHAHARNRELDRQLAAAALRTTPAARSPFSQDAALPAVTPDQAQGSALPSRCEGDGRGHVLHREAVTVVGASGYAPGGALPTLQKASTDAAKT